MSFPDAFVEEVRRTADIARYISEHVQLKKMGASYKGLCPFHQEKTPSFNVNPDRGAFHCFGCGVGGDVFKFAMLHEKVSFPESIELVARRFGIPVPENRYEQGPDRKERDEMLALLDAAATFCSHTHLRDMGMSFQELRDGLPQPARAEAMDDAEKRHVRPGGVVEGLVESWESLIHRLADQIHL